MGDDDILQQMLDVLDEIQNSKPRAEDFVNADGTPDEISYRSAAQQWVQDLQSQVQTVQSLKNEKMGVAELPDGQLVPIDTLSPEERDYVTQYNEQLYNQTLAKYGLEQFNLRRQSVVDENQRRMDEFTAKRGELQDKLSLENNSLDRSLAELDRWLKGQQVAGDDAQRIQTAQQEATKYGTANGKRSFSGNDLGAGVGLLAQQAGIPGDTPLISYPGTQIWDPVADRQKSLASLGVSQQAPTIPQSVLSFADIPSAPTFDAVPQGGGTIPFPSQLLPQWSSPIAEAAKSAISGGGSGVGSGVSSVAGQAAPMPPSVISPPPDIARQIVAR